MKKLLFLLAIALMPGMILLAQSPQAFKYQAIARDDAGNVLSMWDISLRVSLIQEGTDGQIVYVETHKAQTNIYGLINLVIGDGDIVDGDFSSIKWGENRHYIKIEMDIDGGEDYKDVGISQLYAVPYALYAEEAGHLKQPEHSYNTSEIAKIKKTSPSGSGPRGTPNSKISSSGDSWLNALTGNVGIGTSNPSAKLDVNGNALIDTIYADAFSSNSPLLLQTSGTTRIYVDDATGNVGIGTDIPDHSLDIVGDAVADGFRIRRWSDGNETVHRIWDDGGDIQYYNGSANQGHNFITHDGGDAESRMRISGNGDVGIGTASPSQKLHIYHTGGNGQIINEMDGGAFTRWSTTGATPYIGASNDYGFSIVTNNQYRITALNTGRVGINTLSPDTSAILDVKSSDKGFLPPRMTEAQRDAISLPATGLLIYQTDETPGYYYYSGSNWIGIAGAGAGAISTSTCIDYDGNAYLTFTIGNQVWMAENLRVTHYSNGDPIPNITEDGAWSGLNSGAYCWHNNDQSSNGKYYGALYNWYAVVDSRGFCPEGWHFPTDAEWTTLTTYLGGISIAGGKMKVITDLWNSPNAEATNISGFSGLPGGYRHSSGVFTGIGTFGRWWSTTGSTSGTAMARFLNSLDGSVDVLNSDYHNGYSVRCLKDE